MARAIADLGGTSRQSLATARAALDAALKGKNESEAAKFAAELFTALAALDASAPLRRALTDASRDAKDKVKLVNDLFAKGAGSTLALLGELASLKWSRPSDLANAVEQLAIEAEATSANISGELDRLEEELFGFSRVVAIENELLQSLSSNKYSGAIALTDSQKEKLAATLAAKIGQPVRLNVEIDPTVIGGISIRFADELIDATIVNRLAEASRALAG